MSKEFVGFACHNTYFTVHLYLDATVKINIYSISKVNKQHPLIVKMIDRVSFNVIQDICQLFLVIHRRGFRLPQLSHLWTLKNFVSEKSGKYWIKSGNREILRRFIFYLYPRLIQIIHYANLKKEIKIKFKRITTLINLR